MTLRQLARTLRRYWPIGLPNAASRLLVVAGVLLFSAYLAPRTSLRLAVLLAGGMAAVLFLHRPALGLPSLVVVSFTVPFAIGTGTQTSLNVTVLFLPLLLGSWVIRMVHQRTLQVAPSRTTWPLIALVVAATLSLVAGSIPWNPFADTAPPMAQLGGWAVFFLSSVAFLLAANQIPDQRGLELLTWLFLTVGGIQITIRLVPALRSLTWVLFQRGSDGSMFWVWLVALACGQALLNRGLSRRIRGVLALLVLATLGICWLQNRSWASGWLPSLVAVGTIVWLRSWKVGLLATLAVVVAVLVFVPSLPADLIASDRYSIETRIAAWQVLTEVVKANPVLGLGPANYYHYTPLYPIMGWHVRFNSHNQYVDIVAQTGILGLLCFTWFVFEIGRLGWQLRNRFANDFAQGYVYACLGGLIGTLVSGMLADWVLPFVYNIGLAGFRASVFAWIFLGGLVRLEQTARQRSPTPDHL